MNVLKSRSYCPLPTTHSSANSLKYCPLAIPTAVWQRKKKLYI